MTGEVARDGWSDFQLAELWTEPAGRPAAAPSQNVSEACCARDTAAQFVRIFHFLGLWFKSYTVLFDELFLFIIIF